MTDNVSYALLHGVGNVLIASVIGYVLYRLIKTKNSPIKASDYGRNWMAWMAWLATMAGLPKVIMQPNINTVFAWLVPLIVFSAITFALGLMYGKFKIRKKSSINPSVETTKQPDITLNNQASVSGISCSSCGAEITPKGAKFCGRCGAKFEPPKISNVNTDSGTKTKTVSQNISSSSTSKAETVRPPTIEKKIVDEIQPEKIPSENQEKKTVKEAVYINENRGRSNNGVRHNTKESLILLSVFAVLFYFVFIGDSNNTKNNNTYYYGTFSFDNGNVYEGQLMKSLRFPNGRPTYKSGYKFKENGSNSKIENVIKTEESERRSNTQVDFTQLRNHLKYNNGKTTEYYEKNGYTWIEHKYYAGWSKDNQRSGYGLIKFFDSLDTYEGELSNGMMNGYGVFIWANGDHYKGEWKDGKLHGQGAYTFADEGKYVGKWKDGKQHGYGVDIDTFGNKYEGNWKNGIPHGVGHYISVVRGDSYTGEWKNGKKVD